MHNYNNYYYNNYICNVILTSTSMLFDIRLGYWVLCVCFLSAVWFHFSGSHQDFQDGETRQLCCHLSHYGSCKWRLAKYCGGLCILWLCANFFSTWCISLLTFDTCVYGMCVIQVVMGGGQEAMEVTTTSTRIGKFEARWGNVWLRFIRGHERTSPH